MVGSALLVVLFASCVRITPTGDDRDLPHQTSWSGSTQVTQQVTPAPLETTTVQPRPLRSFSIVATGDLLIHTAVAQRAKVNGGSGYSFDPMFDAVRGLLTDPDIAVCHMETPLSRDDTDISGYPMFNAPHEIAMAAAAAGYDTCSTASNHSLDRGVAGITATLDHLDAVGLAHTGTARSQLEADTPNIMTIAGVQVAQLSYTYGANGIPIPTNAPWSVNIIDQEKMLADAAVARAAGAEFVIVSVQWGNEYQRQPTEQQRSLAAALLASPDVDLIIGHHVHVVQPVEKIGGKYVAYGLGNFLSNQSGFGRLPAGTQDGVIIRFDVVEESPGVFRAASSAYTPTYVDRPGYVIRPADPTTNAASYARTIEAITLLGPEAYDGQPTL